MFSAQAPLKSLVTADAAVTAARPSGASDGVDITPWNVGGNFRPMKMVVSIKSEAGTDRTINNPTGGTAGFVEVWVYKLNRDNSTKRWWLAGTLPTYGQTGVVVVDDPGGYLAVIDVPPGAERVHIAGTPSAGAPVYCVEPVEVYAG